MKPAAPRSALLQLCEPLFHYVCFLNRSARKGGGVFDQSYVKGELRQTFADMKARSAADPHLASQYEKVELPLLFFVDAMVKYSKLPFALDWEDLAYERNELAGESKFFELLDRTLAERSDAANERLAVFYTCLGLGFTGEYAGHAVDLRKKMLEISSRIRGLVDFNTQGRVCPEAYEHVDTRNLIEPPARSLGGIAIALVGLVVVLLATNFVLYRQYTQDLATAVETIKGADSSQAQPAPGAPAPGGSR
jgi:type VI secretion system protein ImpK